MSEVTAPMINPTNHREIIVKKVSTVVESVMQSGVLGRQARSVYKRLYILFYLYYSDGCGTTRDFLWLFKSRRMLKYHVDFLERKGFIKSCRSNHGSLFYLTEKGRQLVVHLSLIHI